MDSHADTGVGDGEPLEMILQLLRPLRSVLGSVVQHE
jgi:hypothetical protein